MIPVYNSEDTIGDLVDTVVSTLRPQIRLWEIVLVNDGSADDSHACILQAMERHPGLIRYVRLYRNFGEHNAVICGLNYVTGDCVAIIDDDFQNPPAEIIPLVEKLYEGDYDVVYSYYEKKHHSWFRNMGSHFSDWVANLLLDKPKDLYLSSFKVLRTDVARIVVQYTGPYPYVDGLVLRATTRIGRQLSRHADREAGKSGYTLPKLIRLWMNMSTGFSVTPLRIASILGLLTSSTALVLTIFFVLVRAFGPILIQQNIPPGWASLIVTATFFAGLQLTVLGIMGEYLGRLFLTVSAQPQFLVRETYGVESSPQGTGDES